MVRNVAVFVAILLVASTCTSETADDGALTSDGEPSASTIVINAQVYTVDEAGSWAESFAYDDQGVIIAVGDEAQVRAAVGDAATVIDAQGQLVLPGFQDPHVHVPEAGLNLDVCFFPDGLTLDDYESLAVECAAEQADSEWVRAAGASLFEIRDTAESPLDVLDRAVPDRPVLVLDNLGHAVWTNSLGLQAAGIEAEDPDPTGGVLHRDGQGRLTGLLLEDAQQLVRNAAALDDEANYQALLVAMEELASNGLTTVSDAGGYWAQNHPAAWYRALDEQTLTVRAMNSLYVYPDMEIETQLAEFADRFDDDPDSWLQYDTAKVYIDGILDLGTALLLEPYDVPIDPKYPCGFSYFADGDVGRYVDELHQLGYRINFHVIGDAAVRQALNAVESIDGSADAIAERRHRTTHTYMVDPADVDRFVAIGVVADFQQSADSVAIDYHDFLAEFIGDRAYDLLPTATLLDAGASVSLSSDWDAGPLPPLGTIERALTRDENAVPDLETAVQLATINAAFALGHDDRTGSIEAGKQADFVILDRNIFEAPVEALAETNVVMTVVGGLIVFEG